MKLEFEVGRLSGQGLGETCGYGRKQAGNQKCSIMCPKRPLWTERRHYWRTLYSYDPALALEKVNCPVLALFGALDNSTPVPQTIANMRRALRFAGNRNFNYKSVSEGQSWSTRDQKQATTARSQS